MKALMGGSCRSTLTFVASRKPTESIYFNRLSRVREPVSRAKSGVQGKIADVFNGRSRHAESLTELQAFRILLATAESRTLRHIDGRVKRTIYRRPCHPVPPPWTSSWV